jgi:hypothetical protein
MATEPHHATLTMPTANRARRLARYDAPAFARTMRGAVWTLVITVVGCRADPVDDSGIAATGARPAAASTDSVTARIVDPTAESRAELKATVEAALHGADVTLADDALVQSSLLNLGPRLVRDAQNNPIMGRDLGKPIQFELLRVGDACVLELRGTGERWTLSHTQCVAE